MGPALADSPQEGASPQRRGSASQELDTVQGTEYGVIRARQKVKPCCITRLLEAHDALQQLGGGHVRQTPRPRGHGQRSYLPRFTSYFRGTQRPRGRLL